MRSWWVFFLFPATLWPWAEPPPTVAPQSATREAAAVGPLQPVRGPGTQIYPRRAASIGPDLRLTSP